MSIYKATHAAYYAADAHIYLNFKQEQARIKERCLVSITAKITNDAKYMIFFHSIIMYGRRISIYCKTHLLK